MKKIYLFLILICMSMVTYGQTTVIVYAGGSLPATDSVTGYVRTLPSNLITKDSIFAGDGIQERGYGMFNLSSIPAGATITSVRIGFYLASYQSFSGPPTAWKICGNATNISTITTPATMYAACVTSTVCWPNSWDTTVGSKKFASTAAAVGFISANIGNTVSLGFSNSGSFNRTWIAGESFPADTGLSIHVPYLIIVYTLCAPITPGPIDTICAGSILTLIDTASGGVWSSSNTAVASVTSGGIVTGIAGGTATISYVVGSTGGCTSTVTIHVNGPTPISPSSAINICENNTTTLTDGTSGGTWVSSNPAVATVSGTGLVTGISAGTAIITYTIGSCFVTKLVTIHGPGAITPSTATICVGGTITLTDTTAGGVWSVTNSNATIGSGTGIVTATTAGLDTVHYTSSSCFSIAVITITTGPAAILPSGGVTVCTGTSTTLTDATSGGTWASSTPGVATIGSATGVVTGVATGIATITYSVGSCIATKIITVTAAPAAISPSTLSLCLGSTATLTDATLGGVWSSSAPGTASVGGGVVTGSGVGIATISYTIGTCSATASVSVIASPAAILPAGPISVCTGTTTTLTDATGGGVWSSSAVGIATVAGGIITPVSAGTATITYSVSGCFVTKLVTVTSGAAAIAPSSGIVCTGNNFTFTDVTPGGAWTSANPAIATVAAGVATGVSVGITTISYTVGTCSSTATITVNAGPAAIAPAGLVSLCTGTTTTLTDATAGGVWSSSAVGIATVAGGVVTSVAAGTATITYTVGGCYVTKLVTVTAGAAAIVPASASICAGGSFTFTDVTPGGAWTTGNPAVATVASGVTTGIGAGVATISYTVGICSATATITVNATPVAIAPASAVSLCAGTTTTLTDATAGGVWTSSSASIATVAGGIVTGVAAGTVTITYSISGCFVTKLVTVFGMVAPISPSSASICTGSNLTLTDATSGGIWTTSAPTIATVSASGVVTAIAAGTATISYTAGACTSTASITVNDLPAAVLPPGTLICQGTTATLTDATAGGTWSSSSIAIASIDAAGVVTGVGAGVATISYTVGTCSSTAVVTVSPSPTAIFPASTSVCAGSSISLVESVGGGIWQSSLPAIATVSATGLVTGVSLGNVTISYSIGTCITTATITVNPLPTVTPISGLTGICGIGSILLSDATLGGVWSASNGNATVNAGGVVTGVATGTDIISYTVSNGCGSISATFNVSIDGAPNAMSIYGPSTICAGSFTILADSMAGGLWSTSNATAAISVTGIVTGLTSGMDTITYTVTNACGSAFTTKTISVLPLPAPGPISGANSVCQLSSITLTNPVPGGVWSSANPFVTISASGVVTGVSAGVDTVLYSLTNGCGTVAATWVVTVYPIANAGTITGPVSVCQGSMITLIDLVSGGSYSSSNANATVIPSTGVVSGVNPGIDTITYTVINMCGSATTTKIINVFPLPAPAGITGLGSVCVGAAITLNDATTGGTWSTSNTSATVTTTGIVTGLVSGLDTIMYSIINSCGTGFSSAVVLVNPLPDAGTISGGPFVCVGSTITLTDAIPGGTWTASNANVTLSGTGVVLGVTPGMVTITYTVTNICGTASVSIPLTVDAYPTAGVISGSSVVCQGATMTLSETLSGGTWSSGITTLATISGTGVVTGVSGGTDTISYTIINSCGTVGTFKIISIMALPAPGVISGGTGVCLGSNITLVDTPAGGVWTAGNGFATVSAIGVVTGVSVGIDPISYTLTNSCGTVSAIANIAVVTFPVSGVIIGPATVCEGATISLSNADTGGVWTASNGNATTSITGNVTGITAGTDSIFYTVTNACGSAVSNMVLTVNPTPVIGAISGATGICIGSVTNLTDAVAGGTWASSNPAIASIIATTGVLSGVSAGVSTISYSITNGFGCVGLATVSDTVFAIPTATPITGTRTLCAGATTLLGNLIAFGSWSSANNAIATVNAGTGLVTGVAAGTVIITYDVANMCGTITDTATITVHALPVIAPIVGSSTTICSGASTIVSDATSGGRWSSSDTSIAKVGLTTGIVNGIAAGSVTITYTVTNSFGCMGDVTLGLNFGSSIGTSYVTPTSATICNGHTVYMQVITSGSGLTYQWMRNGVNITGANLYHYTTDSPGSYSVIISNGTCEETLTGTTVSVITRPVIGYTAPNILYTGSYATYQWFRNGITIPGATSSVYHELGAGTYVVIVTDVNGCTDTSGTYVITGGGGGGGGSYVTNVVNGTDIVFYPNPATSAIHIDAPVSVSIKIFSPDGKLVIVQNDTKEVNISTLANGMYIIMVYDQDNLLVKTDKFMKL